MRLHANADSLRGTRDFKMENDVLSVQDILHFAGIIIH